MGSNNSKDFFWSWSYKDHRVCIVLDEFEPNQWRVKITLTCLQTHECGCSSTLPGTDDLTFSSAKEGLRAAEGLAYRYIDENWA